MWCGGVEGNQMLGVLLGGVADFVAACVCVREGHVIICEF